MTAAVTASSGIGRHDCTCSPTREHRRHERRLLLDLQDRDDVALLDEGERPRHAWRRRDDLGLLGLADLLVGRLRPDELAAGFAVHPAGDRRSVLGLRAGEGHARRDVHPLWLHQITRVVHAATGLRNTAEERQQADGQKHDYETGHGILQAALRQRN